MVKQGIVLGHVLKKGIEVGKAKIDLIANLPPSKKDIRLFLGHADFYRRFVKDFSKIARLTNLLSKDVPFDFTPECFKAFELLKKELTSAPIIHAPDWSEQFELMCAASDYAIGAVLSQRFDKQTRDLLCYLKMHS